MSRLYVIVVFGFAEVGRHLSALTRRNAGRDALHFESGAILIAIVALVGGHRRDLLPLGKAGYKILVPT